MSQFEKLKQKIMESPCRKDITVEEVKSLVTHLGLKVSEGANHTKICDPNTQTIIPVPRHGKHVPEYVIKELQDLIEKIEG